MNPLDQFRQTARNTLNAEFDNYEWYSEAAERALAALEAAAVELVEQIIGGGRGSYW